MTGTSEESALAGGVDDATLGQHTAFTKRLGRIAPVNRGEMRRGEMPLQVDVDHAVELSLLHREAHGVSDEAGIVDQNVQIAESRHCRSDEFFGVGPIAHTAPIRDSSSAVGRDRCDDVVDGR